MPVIASGSNSPEKAPAGADPKRFRRGHYRRCQPYLVRHARALDTPIHPELCQSERRAIDRHTKGQGCRRMDDRPEASGTARLPEAAENLLQGPLAFYRREAS